MAKKPQKTKKYTQNQQAFLKEVKRIERYLNRKKKEHLYIPDFSIPDLPARVTPKRLREIKAMTGRSLSKKLKQIPVESIRIETTPDFIPPSAKETKVEDLEGFDWSNFEVPTYEEEPTINPDFGDTDDPNAYGEKIEYDDTPWTKADDSYSVISNFLEQLREIPTAWHQEIQSLMDAWIHMYGEDEVAAAIDKIPWRMRDFIKKNGSEFDFVAYNASFISYIDVADPGDKAYFEDLMSQMESGEYYV